MMVRFSIMHVGDLVVCAFDGCVAVVDGVWASGGTYDLLTVF